ncbi:unnamed protein product [Symbiodinium microadriaticum]|nr:unnamed protein product [Symbiodinium microadriaticum]
MTAWSVLVVLGVLTGANEVRARPTAVPSSGLVLEAVHHEVDKASSMGQKVSELEAQLTSIKRTAEVQAAETKAALVSLKEKLVFAEEKEAETEGELEVSEEHVKDLEKQLAEAPPSLSFRATALNRNLSQSLEFSGWILSYTSFFSSPRRL